MISKVSVKNYQSLYDVEVNLGKFTVIFGNSDVGKSAFYRAIRAVIVGELGDEFISSKTNRVGVSVKTTSGKEVVWLKSRGKSSTYFLFSDGVKTNEWRRARTLPNELADVLSLRKVLIDGEALYPNLRGQFDPLFLLFESPGKKARVLGALLSNVLLQGIKQANLERNRNEADVRAMTELAESYEKRLNTDWDGLLKKAETLKVQYKLVERAASNLKEAKALFSSLRAVEQKTVLVDSVLRSTKEAEELAFSCLDVLSLYDSVFPLVSKWKKMKRLSESRIEAFPEEELEELRRDKELFDSLSPSVTRFKIYNRDLVLSEYKVKTLEKEVKSLDILIAKSTITCPYCGKEFKHEL